MSPATLVYKSVANHPLELDIHLPSESTSSSNTENRGVPAVIWFHGGGGFGGTKAPKEDSKMFPFWMRDLTTRRLGWAFISANYRLLVPWSAHHILEDIKDVFRFAASNEISTKYGIDTSRLIVGGDSFGGCCARLAALYADPRPKGLISLYGMGGNYLTPFWLGGRTSLASSLPMPSDSTLDTIPNPDVEKLFETTETMSETHMGSSINSDGERVPLHPRGNMFGYCIQKGDYLDWYTGIPGVSKRLELSITTIGTGYEVEIDPAIRSILPELNLTPTSQFPSTYLIHGTADSSVPCSETLHTYHQLQNLGVEDCVLVSIEQGEHYCDGALSSGKAEDGDPWFERVKSLEAWMRRKVE